MVTNRRMNTFTSRKRGGTKQTSAKDKAKTSSTKTSSKEHLKPNYAQIAKEVHTKLQQTKLTSFEKVEQNVLNYKLKKLLKLPKKEFIAYLKKNFTKEDVRLILEIICIEVGYNCAWYRKKWDSMIDDDKIYSELYVFAKKSVNDCDTTNNVLQFFKNIFLVSFFYGLQEKGYDLIGSNRSSAKSLDGVLFGVIRRLNTIIIALYSTRLFRKLKFVKKIEYTKNIGVITDSSIKKKLEHTSKNEYTKKRKKTDR